MLRTFVEKGFKRLARDINNEAERRRRHPQRILLEAAQHDSADYARKQMSGALIFERREEILDLALQRMPQDGLLLEFGVAGGDSIRYLAARTKRAIDGFDSFEGLPDDWPGRHEIRGHYSTDGLLPSVPANVTLHKGWFDKTLPPFLARKTDPAALVHVDCDLYRSTRTILDLLKNRICPGTVIVFDEYFNFVGWREHEFRAFQEFVQENDANYRYLAWSFQQAVVVIGK